MSLLLNHLRRSWKIGVLASIGLFAFQVIVVRVLSTGTADIGQFLPRGLQAFFSLDQMPLSTLPGMLSLAYQHPFVLVGLLAVPVAIASGALAAEVEKKTVTFLLARPISPVWVVLSATTACVFWCAVLSGATIAGTLAGIEWMKIHPGPDPRVLARIAFGMWMLGVAVSGLAILASAWSSERSDAIGWAVTVSLIMYVWNFLGQVWVEAKPFVQYSLFHYYSPSQVLMSGSVSMQNYQVLGGTFLTSVLLACVIWRFRDFEV